MIAYRLLLISIFSITFTNINGAIRYVAESGQGTFDGSTWENALNGNALQTAINSAGTGDSIWVACGTYFPSNTGNRNLSFSMRNDVSIFGSFQGDEEILEDRSFICGPCSILSGDIGTSNVQTDNTYTLVVNNGLNRSAILDGFIIRDGYDDRSVSNIENGLGGGIYNGGNGSGANCSPTFRNLVIINNCATYGAGMFNNGYGGGNSEPLLEQCIIAFNTATIGGGGMDSYGWNNGNVAPILTNCIFYENTSFDRAGGMYCWGGFNGNCSPIITNSAFINNSSTNIAGGIIADNSDNLNGNPPFSGTAEISFINSLAWGNTSAQGPQFYNLGTGHFNATYSSIDTIGQGLAHVISGSNVGNIFSIPNFLNINNAIGLDDCWMSADDGLNLSISSNAINGGVSNNLQLIDINQNQRISGAAVDIGPYEYQLLDSVIWKGNANTVWENENNWLPSRIPDATQHVTIPDNLLNYPLILDRSISIRSLLLENNSQIQITGSGALNVLGN